MKDLSYFLGSITTRFKYHYSLLPEKVSEDQAFDDSAIFEKIIYQTDCSNGPLNEQRNPEISFPTERETIWSLAKPILVRCPAIGRRDPRKQGAKRHRLVCLGAARIRSDRIADLPAESRSRGILGELTPARCKAFLGWQPRGLAETLSARSCRRWRSGPLVREAVVSG